MSRSRAPWDGRCRPSVICHSLHSVLGSGRFFKFCSVTSHLCAVHSIGLDTSVESPSWAHTKPCPPGMSHPVALAQSCSCPQAWATADLFQILWFFLFSHFILPPCTKWSFLCPLPALFPKWDVHVRRENGKTFEWAPTTRSRFVRIHAARWCKHACVPS